MKGLQQMEKLDICIDKPWRENRESSLVRRLPWVAAAENLNIKSMGHGTPGWKRRNEDDGRWFNISFLRESTEPKVK